MVTAGWGIIGAGKLADISIAPAISRDENSALVAVCSRDGERARAFADKFGAPGAYSDYKEFLADASLDAVYIASPNNMHKEQVLDALAAGKHVLVEKPMALTVEDGIEMRDAAAAADRLLGIGFQLRHKSTTREARRLIADGKLGRVFNAELAIGAGKGIYPYDTWRADAALAGGGTVLNQGTHVIDLLEFLTGQRIVEVAAFVDHDDLEDVFVGTFRLDGGALATLSSQQLHGGIRPDWVVMGETAWLHGRMGTFPAPGDELLLGEGMKVTPIGSTSGQSAYDAEIAAFAAAVVNGESFDADGTDGIRNIAVVEAIYQSVRERRTITVQDVT